MPDSGIDVQLDVTWTYTAPEDYEAGMLVAMKRIAAQLAGELAKEVPKDQSQLAGSFVSEAIGPFEARAGSNLVYAKHAWLGTAPHFPPREPIEEWAGRKGLPFEEVYFGIAKRGTKGDDYVGRAESTTEPLMPEILETMLRQQGVIS